MTSTLVSLAIAARLAAGATARRCLGKLEPEPDRVAFRREFEALLKSAPPDAIRAAKWIEMPASEPPWCESGLSLEPGEHVTWFACGRVYVAKALDIFAPPALQVWARIGTRGAVFAGTRDHHSFANDRDAQGTEAPASEPLYFGNYFPNDWSSREGATAHPPEIHRSAKGGTTILVIVWRGTSTAGLRALADTAIAGAAQRAVTDEIERLAQGRTAPEGWSYLWHLGEAEIFRAGVAPGGGPSVRCHTHRDVGILQRNVDFELTPDTRIAWRWKVDELPARLREDTTPTHDYLSLAVEFDNGLDLSYYWSTSLPRERFYACPLENWKHKETHLVVRSGRAGLGEWRSEDRALHIDYQRAIGTQRAIGPHKAIGNRAVGSAQATRITRVWFIAVSLFQRNTGSCEYTDIRLSNAEHTLVVL